MGVKVMPYSKGQSGNMAGRPKLTDAQKDERERFKALLKTATLPALKSVIAIACDEKHRDRFKACQFIIEKAYGENTAFLADEFDNEPFTIHIVRSGTNKKVQDDEDDWN